MSFVPYHKLVLQSIWAQGNRIAMIDGESEETLTFRDVYTLSYALAAGLGARGVAKGDVIVQCMANDIRSPVVFLAVALTGAICSGVNSNASVGELEKQIKDSEAKYIFASASAIVRIKQAVKNAPLVKKVIIVDDGVSYDPWPLSDDYDDLMRMAPNFEDTVVFEEDDVIILPYSSGTTGHPKGVMLTHKNLLTLISLTEPMKMRGLAMMDIPEDFLDRPTLLVVPFYHMTGFNSLMNSMRSGFRVVVIKKFVPERYLQLIQKYKPVVLGCVPPMIGFLTKSPLTYKYDLSSVQLVTCGAAPLGKELSQEFVHKFPFVRSLLQGYGMTELTLVTHGSPPVPRNEIRHGSIGQLIDGIECQLVDPESRKIISETHKPGEIWVRSKTVMKGYLHRPDATAHTKDSEGWLHTGDVAYFDEDGYYYIVDRIKELIKVKGLQVAPAELEDILMSHAEVLDAAVVGVPDEKAGQVPRAYVVRKSGSSITDQDIIQFVREHVASYKHLAGGVHFVQTIPRSPSGKILRRVLAQQNGTDQLSKL